MKRYICFVTCLMLVALPLCAFASGSAWFDQYLVSVTMQSGQNSATYDVPVAGLGDVANGFTGEYDWSLPGAVSLYSSGGSLLGKLTGLSLTFYSDPYIGLDFTVLAGSADTTFTIQTGMNFSSISNPTAYSSAGITATDRNQNQVAITGLWGGGNSAYRSGYNGSVVFYDLVSLPTFIGGPRATLASSGSSGLDTISGSVSSMQAAYKFTVSAGDSASGTSFYEITPVPEPGSLLALSTGLFGLAGFAVRRRRV